MNDSKLFFFTYFNSNFLIQGTAAISSFLREHPNSHGYIYCDDKFTASALNERFKGESLTIQLFNEIPKIKQESEFMELNRDSIELLISLKPFLFLETLSQLSEADLLIYIDADLFFYGSAKLILAELGDCDILLTQHIFPQSLLENVKYGQVNAGLILLRKSKASTDLLLDWAAKCRNWCQLRLEDGKYADQLYLDNYLTDVSVNSIANPGLNNGMYYFQEKRRLQLESDTVLIDSFNLICFHFHGIRITRKYILTGFNRYNLPSNPFRVWKLIYSKYLNEIKKETMYFVGLIGQELMNERVFFDLPKQRFIAVKRFRRTFVSNRRIKLLDKLVQND